MTEPAALDAAGSGSSWGECYFVAVVPYWSTLLPCGWNVPEVAPLTTPKAVAPAMPPPTSRAIPPMMKVCTCVPLPLGAHNLPPSHKIQRISATAFLEHVPAPSEASQDGRETARDHRPEARRPADGDGRAVRRAVLGGLGYQGAAPAETESEVGHEGDRDEHEHRADGDLHGALGEAPDHDGDTRAEDARRERRDEGDEPGAVPQ